MNKYSISLVLGILIPIAMIVLVALMIYLPSFYIKPKYGFLYSTSYDYYSSYEFAVQNGKLTKNPIDSSYKPPVTPKEQKLYLHNVETNKSEPISFEDASALNLSDSPKSEDGFEVVNGTSSGSFLFSSSDYNSHYLKKDAYSKKLDLITGSSYGFRFIGWVMN